MSIDKIAVLTDQASWFLPYSKKFVQHLKDEHYDAELFTNHKNVDETFDTVFILSYFNLIEKSSLAKRKHNLVVHESDLPEGKGWAPLFWQIIEGKNEIPIVLFEATEKADAGDIYLKDTIVLDGSELHDEIREKQAVKTIQLCQKFINDFQFIHPAPQKGESSYYPKRGAKDSELNIDKSIKEQFNSFRIASNDDYPAFFYHNGEKYILTITKDKEKL